MLCTHTLDSVVEVLMMVIARQMIISHGTPVQNLISCMAIALLFVIRKFLFIPYLDQIPESKNSIVGSVMGLFRKKPVKGGVKEPGNEAVQAARKTEQ
jgi:phage-related protein